MKKKCAIIQLPGSNCEYETLKALHYVGLNADIVSWNAKIEEVKSYSAFVIPGGFSFQDRVRAGAIAAQLPVFKVIKEKAQQGTAVLGICNGCQILAELGVFNEENINETYFALAPNVKKSEPYGFVCDWVNVKFKNPQKNIFTTQFTEEDIIPIQINHGEGNFQCSESFLTSIDQLATCHYCDKEGREISPNGSMKNIAAISNNNGNVLAMMPHPERGFLLKQIPAYLNNEWSMEKRKDYSVLAKGPWEKLFVSLKLHLEKNA